MTNYKLEVATDGLDRTNRLSLTNKGRKTVFDLKYNVVIGQGDFICQVDVEDKGNLPLPDVFSIANQLIIANRLTQKREVLPYAFTHDLSAEDFFGPNIVGATNLLCKRIRFDSDAFMISFQGCLDVKLETNAGGAGSGVVLVTLYHFKQDTGAGPLANYAALPDGGAKGRIWGFVINTFAAANTVVAKTFPIFVSFAPFTKRILRGEYIVLVIDPATSANLIATGWRVEPQIYVTTNSEAITRMP